MPQKKTRIIVVDTCPACQEDKVLSDTPEGNVQFTEALCFDCREQAVQESQMDSFDVAYARASANGWAD